MLFLELALQNVTGFSPAARTPLKPGYWVLRPPGVAPLASVFLELCFADGRGGDKVLVAPGQRTGRAGILIQGNDGSVYRLTREFGGAGGLHRQNPQSQAFEPITSSAAEIVTFLRSQVGLPTRTTYAEVFTFSGAQLPSKRPDPALAKPKPAPVSSRAPANPVAEIRGLEAKLAELRREVTLSETVNTLQFNADGLAGQAFALEEQLRSTHTVEVALKEAQAAYAAAPTPELMRLPPDIVARAERMPEIEAKLAEGLAKLEDDKKIAEAAIAPTVPPLSGDWRFWAGMGGGALALAIGAFTGGMVRYAAFIAPLAFGYAALVALKYVEDVKKSQQRTRKEDRIADRETKLRNQHAYEANPVRIAIQSLGVETPEEVIEVFGRRARLGEKVEELETQLAIMQVEPEYAAAVAQLAQVKIDQERINEELTQKGAYIRDPMEVQREIARAEEALAALTQPPEPPPLPQAPEPVKARPDPMPALMRLLSDLFSTDVPTLGNAFKDRSSQYLAALTEKRWTAMEIDLEGRATVAGANGRVPVGQLAPRDLDFAYLALRLTALEKFSARYKIPVLLEDAFVGIDASKQPLLGRMFKHLGTLTQVLHVSQTEAFVSAADGSVNV